MLDFDTRCMFPCLCESCRKMEPVDLLAKRPYCPDCRSARALIPYDDPALNDGSETRTVFDWQVDERLGRVLKLTDANYRCPRCGKMSMKFEDVGCWD